MGKVPKHSNPEYIHAMRELRKSNAAQPHEDKRKKKPKHKKKFLEED